SRKTKDVYTNNKKELTTKEKRTTKTIEIKNIREKYGYVNVHQLIIYRINKGNQSIEEFEKNNTDKINRHPLNFEKEPIGINILIPGTSDSSNLETYISAKIKNQYHMIDESEFSEEE